MIDDIRGLPGLPYKALNDRLSVIYGPCCDTHEKLSVPNPVNLEGDLLKLIKTIWRLKGMPDNIDNNIVTAFANIFWKGVTEGYGKTLTGITYDTPDYNMLMSLRNDVYQFSAAKNFQQMKALTEALIGEDGKLLTFRAFKEQAQLINNKFVGAWLETEWVSAIGSAQMSSKWVQIQQDKSVLGILEFDAVIDGRTTDFCRSLNKTRKPVEDSFWSIYYPPNHFRERSTVRQLSSGTITNTSDIVYPDIPDMFKTNLAQSGLVFPSGHPYYNGLPEDFRTAAKNLAGNG